MMLRRARTPRKAERCERVWKSLAVVVASAALAGSAGFVFDGLRLLQDEAAPLLSDAPERAHGATAPRAPDARELGALVLARNMFDSRTGPLAWQEPSPQPVATGETAALDAQAEPPPAPCDNAQLRLVASVVNSMRPEHSFAALRVDGKTHMFGIGDRLGDVTLIALRPAYAYVRHGKVSACTLPVFLPASQRPRPAPQAAAAARAPAPGKSKTKAFFSAQELAAGVRDLGGGRYAVSKALLMRALRSPTGTGLGARMQAVERYGRTVGYELARLRKDSPLARMGLKKGDLLRNVNGHELSDAGALLVALRMLQQTDSVTLGVVRDNVVQHLQYTLD